MTDIVERLRSARLVTHNPDDPSRSVNEIVNPTERELEAADEIQRLRAERDRLRECQWLTDEFMDAMFWFVRKNYGDGFPVDEQGSLIGWNDWLRTGIAKAIARAALSDTENPG